MPRAILGLLLVLTVIGPACPVSAQTEPLTAFIQSEEGSLSKQEIAETFLDPGAALEDLTAWGWTENAYWTFVLPDEQTADGPPRASVELSLRRFASADGVAAALPYFLDARAEALGLVEVPVEIADGRGRALRGSVEAGAEFTIFVPAGDTLVRVTAVSRVGDPRPYAEEAAQAVLGVAAEPGSTSPERRTTTAELSLRERADPSAPLLGVIPAGASVTLTHGEPMAGYVPVEYEGRSGWALEEFLSAPENAASAARPPGATSVPVIEQEPARQQEEQPTPGPSIPGGPGMIGSDYPGPPPAAALQSATCTLVELHPGYPGYRGFITGLYGSGEGACLEELERLYPWFDRSVEDAENMAAAVRLGLAGGASTWVWENWLAIEDERGLSPTCYMEAFKQLAAGVSYRRIPIAPDDARLLVGTLGSSELIGRSAAEAGMAKWKLEEMFLTDYDLRAIAWGASGSRHNDAIELKTAIDQYVTWLGSPDRGYPDTSGLQKLITTQGGYAPVPASACPDDQIFLAGITAEASYYAVIPPQIASALLGQFEVLVTQWLGERATGSTQSLRRFLKANMNLYLG
jgi:hypothetical protein